MASGGRTAEERGVDGVGADAGAPTARRIQEGFKVVTIEVGATEDDGLRHLEPLDHLEQHLWLEALDGL